MKMMLHKFPKSCQTLWSPRVPPDFQLCQTFPRLSNFYASRLHTFALKKWATMERPKITSVRLICEPSTYFANTCPNHVNHRQSRAGFYKVGPYSITNCPETFISRFFWATRLALASIFLILSLFFLFGPETILGKGSSSQQIHVAEIWNPAREKSLANEVEDGKAPVVTICPQNKVSRSQFLSALASPNLPWKGLRIFLIKVLDLSLFEKITWLHCSRFLLQNLLSSTLAAFLTPFSPIFTLWWASDIR